MADVCIADPVHGFADFADPDCRDCDTAHDCGRNVYEMTLTQAACLYERAGLSLLAARVRKISQACASTGWRAFDSRNATTGL